MAFDDINQTQRNLIIRLVEELASGNYGAEVFAVAAFGRGWFITLGGVGGAPDKELDQFDETDLHALAPEGYITLLAKKHGYSLSLKPKAYEEYKAYRLPGSSIPSDDQNPTRVEKGAPVMTFDESQLERIAATSTDLLEGLHKNYNLSREQAAKWFRWTLAVSIFGLGLLGVGIALVFSHQAPTATVTSISGILAEFLALIFFKQADTANKRQDQYHRDLLKRQQILDAVQLAGLISQGHERDRIVEAIIRSLLGIEQQVLIAKPGIGDARG